MKCTKKGMLENLAIFEENFNSWEKVHFFQPWGEDLKGRGVFFISQRRSIKFDFGTFMQGNLK